MEQSHNQAPHDSSNQGNDNGWGSFDYNNITPRGKYVQGPDGRWIPEDKLDEEMDKFERKQYEEKKTNEDREVLMRQLKRMEDNPDRLDNFEGEHVRGATNYDEERATLSNDVDGMYAAQPDGTPLSDEAMNEITRKMRDVEDFWRFEADDRYKDYIDKERAKIGTTYKNRDDFIFHVVPRLRRLEKGSSGAEEKDSSKANANPNNADPGTNPEDINPNSSSDDNPEADPPFRVEDFDDVPDDPSEHEPQHEDNPFKEQIRVIKEKMFSILPNLAGLLAKSNRNQITPEQKTELDNVKAEYGKYTREYLGVVADYYRQTGEERNAKQYDEAAEKAQIAANEHLNVFKKTAESEEKVHEEEQRLKAEMQRSLNLEYNTQNENLKQEITNNVIHHAIEWRIILEEEIIKAQDKNLAYSRFMRKLHRLIRALSSFNIIDKDEVARRQLQKINENGVSSDTIDTSVDYILNHYGSKQPTPSQPQPSSEDHS